MKLLKMFTLQSRIERRIKELDIEIDESERSKYDLSRKPSEYVGALQEIKAKRAVKKALEELV